MYGDQGVQILNLTTESRHRRARVGRYSKRIGLMNSWESCVTIMWGRRYGKRRIEGKSQEVKEQEEEPDNKRMQRYQS